MCIRLAIIPVALALLSTPVRAAATDPPAVPAVVPDSAVAVLELRGSLVSLRGFFEGDPALRSELGAFLERTLGLDLTTIESAVAWSSQLSPAPTFGALLRLPRGGSLRGVKTGSCDEVDLIRVGELAGASLPVGLLVGHEAEICRAIMVAHKKAAPLARDSPLSSPLADRAADLVAVLDPAAMGDKDVSALAQQYGARSVALSLRGGKLLQLEVSGDANKLQAAQALLTNVANLTLARLKTNMEQAAQGDDVAEGAGAIIRYHEAVKLWSKAAPKMVGGKLVSQYPFPEISTFQSLGVIGVLAAVAIPATMKYVRRSKTVEAMTNLRRLSDSAAAYLTSHKARFPKSTTWTPERLCCGGDAGKCQPDAHAWDAPTWKALDFSINEPHYYQYRVVVEGKGKSTVLAIEARGDLDCDGKFSLFRREVRLDEQGRAYVPSGFFSKDDLE
jgi:Tfp pilus assembly major pilin PilA